VTCPSALTCTDLHHGQLYHPVSPRVKSGRLQIDDGESARRAVLHSGVSAFPFCC